MMEAARSIMVHTARRQELVTYPELNRQMAEDTGSVPFNLSRDAERSALGTLLADVVKDDLLHSRFMLSSVAALAEPGRGSGDGFDALAEQLKLTHDHYKRRI
jgi:hypothetical protein